MHVLFISRDTSYRFVEGLLHEVLARGGRATIISRDTNRLQQKLAGTPATAAAVEAAQPNTAWSARWLRVTRELRSYLHWLRLRAQPDFLLDRWLNYLPLWLRGGLRLARRLGLERALTGRWLQQALARCEAAARPSRNIAEQIRRINPSLVVITPLLYPEAWEIEYLKACIQLGQPHAALVASWDNLSSKGIFHVQPAHVLVWNEVQVREAAAYHGLPRASVSVIGAPTFDWLFSYPDALSREAFCGRMGLDPARPYVLYGGSSAIHRGDETAIVRELRAQLDRLAPGRVQILVRPHPANLAGLQELEAPDVRVSARPATLERAVVLADLYNALFHAEAMVGLNTSLLLEAAILDRPCLTLLFAGHADAAAKKHTQFPHFQYLLDGQFMEVAENEEACAARIVEILDGRDRLRVARLAFVQSFIRPHGMHTPARRVAVDLFERLAPEAAAPAEAGAQKLAAVRVPPTRARA